MPGLDLLSRKWCKSSFSGGNGGDCVEVATGDRTISVRNSKDRSGPVVTFTPDEWRAFINGVKAGEFDLP